MDLKKLNILILLVEMYVLLYLFYLTKPSEKNKGHMQTQQKSKSVNSEDIIFDRVETTPEEIGNLPFLKTFRNPCVWTAIYLNKPRLRLQCLPYFYLAGFPKCGTTDLYKRMVTHPLVSGKCGKENHWLTRKRFLENNNVLSNYFNYYERSVREDISRIFANGYHSAIFGDCSASTVWDNRHLFKEQKRQNKTNPLLTTADIIFKLNPNAKIIILLRNPTLRYELSSLKNVHKESVLLVREAANVQQLTFIVQKTVTKTFLEDNMSDFFLKRLYSDYAYFNKYNVTPKDFHNRVVKGIGAFETCLRFQNIEECANNFNQKDSVRLNIGLYYIYIRYFMRAFPKDQVKIIKLEDFSINKLFHMRNIFYFLEIGIPPASILNRVVDMAEANNNTEKKASAGTMWRKTITAIDSFYKPYNQKLADLIGQDFNYNL